MAAIGEALQARNVLFFEDTRLFELTPVVRTQATCIIPKSFIPSTGAEGRYFVPRTCRSLGETCSISGLCVVADAGKRLDCFRYRGPKGRIDVQDSLLPAGASRLSK